MKNLDSKIYSIGGVVIVILLAVLGFLYFQSTRRAPAPGEGNTILPGVVTTASSSGYTIEQVPVSDSPAAPSLDHKIVFGANVPADIRVTITSGAATVASRIKKDPTNANDWFSLGIWYHTAEDFSAAKDVWLFLAKAVTPPGNAVALDNLGKLYHYDLKDYPKAESYFKQAIAADPAMMNSYDDLYQLYLYSYKQDTSAAVDILNKEAAQFPKSYAPYLALGTYYAGKKDTAGARTALNKAMDRARAAEDVAAMKVIGDELAKLPPL